ncbi:MAG: hypothetical protein NC336_04815 [Clostridium sp.]|nr:hypothetical protein [Clostridium sp.]
MERLRAIYLVLAAAALTLQGCIYDYPPEGCVDASRPLEVSLAVDSRRDTLRHMLESRSGNTPLHHFTAALVDRRSGQVVSRQTLTSADSTATLRFDHPAGTREAYDIVGVCLRSDSGLAVGELPFDLSEMRDIKLTGDIHHGRRDLKQIYTASAVTDQGESVGLRLPRAMAEYRVIATDAAPVATGLTVTVRYADYNPSAYDPVRRTTTDAVITEFGTAVRDLGSGEYLLAEDAVFTASDSTVTRLRIEITTPGGETVSRTPLLTIPVRRGSVTELRGPFFSMHDSGGGGGVTIDPDFSGTFWIIVD